MTDQFRQPAIVPDAEFHVLFEELKKELATEDFFKRRIRQKGG